jgi:hypothetical protein
MFKLKEVRPKIFLMDFDDSYDLAMHFVRYQECYESPSKTFRDSAFSLIDFMEWYSKKYGNGSFTYPADWGGFNIPGEMIAYVERLGVPDPNRYDEVMQDVYRQCAAKTDKFYLIGTVGENTSVLQHEIAHGFFYTTPKYRKAMKRLVTDHLPRDCTKNMFQQLKTMGYAARVYIDECQAYMATGLTETMPGTKADREPFIELFNKYYEGV